MCFYNQNWILFQYIKLEPYKAADLVLFVKSLDPCYPVVDR